MLKQPLAANYKHPPQTPGVLIQPDVYQRLLCGIDQVVDAIRPTLGPAPRLTFIERHPRSEAPELLDDGGLIARRIIELPDQHENVGAMLVRGMLWRLHQQVGDGTATAAVLFQTIFREGVRYIAAGGNAMLLRRHLEQGAKLLIDLLTTQVLPVTDSVRLHQLVRSVCADPVLADALEAALNIVGEYGLIDVQSGHTLNIRPAYFEGCFWSGGRLSAKSADGMSQSLELVNPTVVLTDFMLDEPAQVVPLLRLALQEKIETLVIVARGISDSVAALLQRSESSARLRVVMIKTPGTTVPAQIDALTDLSILTGAVPLLTVTGETFEQVRPHHLGAARRIWLDNNYLSVRGGKGDILKLHQHITALKKRYADSINDDSGDSLRQRIGRLSGGLVILYTGGATKSEADFRKETFDRCLRTIRRSLHVGALPGGGVALLACRDRLHAHRAASQSDDERAAYSILLRALRAPFDTLANNAGFDPGVALACLEQEGDNAYFDFATGKTAGFDCNGVLDSAAAQIEALHAAVKTAALALTIDAVVYRRQPEISMLPD